VFDSGAHLILKDAMLYIRDPTNFFFNYMHVNVFPWHTSHSLCI